MAYTRFLFFTLQKRLLGPRQFIQILAGPRQVGKTMLAEQAAAAFPGPLHFASADAASFPLPVWIEQQWNAARSFLKQPNVTRVCLFLDEIQKVQDWSTTVKRLWDEDSKTQLPLQVVLLGSSPLLVQKGLNESLTGRFEVIPVTHWSYAEMQEAFGLTLSQYIYFGGYPGAAQLIQEETRWTRYILESLVEVSIAHDILFLSRVDKPALLRQLFLVGSAYSGQILSYQKIMGQLQDAGNTTTLAHYLTLLSGAGLVAGLPKYSGSIVQTRASSPKFQVFNTAFLSVYSRLDFQAALQTPDFWGRLVESAVGAYLLNQARLEMFEVFYWRDRNDEVDFVVRHGKKLCAIEVKSGRMRVNSGMAKFASLFPTARLLQVGGHGIPLDTFLLQPILSYF